MTSKMKKKNQGEKYPRFAKKNNSNKYSQERKKKIRYKLI